MEASPVWYNVPIIREEGNKTKRVRWSDKLTQVKAISPRYKAEPFSWPQQKSCSHFVCTAGQPCKMFARFSVSQDPGLAQNNNNQDNYYYGKPDKKDLSLNLGNNYPSYWSKST